MNIRSINEQIFPPHCLLCGGSGGALCPACTQDLPWLQAAHCPVCALPTPSGLVCGHCLKEPPAFTHTQALFAYDFPVDQLIQHLKYLEKLTVAPLMGDLLAAHWQGHLPDVWLPMPLHNNRLRERGFNQAVEIARTLAAATAVPMHPDWATRQRDTPSQAGLARDARRKNLRGAFASKPQVAGLHIGIVDDVMTTGSTLNALAEALKQAGAKEVSCAVLARA